mmetsp:Transcript_108616/g.324790  ORF Transcript_108616/g.324790 Transcript_108616/m.324790 type:complete len:231 (-) Transcript_108616:700-1392(-)
MRQPGKHVRPCKVLCLVGLHGHHDGLPRLQHQRIAERQQVAAEDKEVVGPKSPGEVGQVKHGVEVPRKATLCVFAKSAGGLVVAGLVGGDVEEVGLIRICGKATATLKPPMDVHGSRALGHLLRAGDHRSQHVRQLRQPVDKYPEGGLVAAVPLRQPQQLRRVLEPFAEQRPVTPHRRPRALGDELQPELLVQRVGRSCTLLANLSVDVRHAQVDRVQRPRWTGSLGGRP